MDELGRATGTRDGLAIATAMSEALLQSNATVYFATHFAELAKGLANNIGVVNRHLKTVTEYSESAADVPVMKMMYRVTEGPETEVSYGIALAKAIGFPDSFIAHAEKVAAEIRAQAQASKRDRQEIEEAKRRKLVANLVRQLQLAHESDADDEELSQYLKQIHDDFWAKMLSSSEDKGEVYEDDGDEDRDSDGAGGEEGDEVEEAVDNSYHEEFVSPAVEGKYAVKSPGDLDLFGDDIDDDVDDGYGDLYKPGSAANAIMIDDDDDMDDADDMGDVGDIGDDYKDEDIS